MDFSQIISKLQSYVTMPELSQTHIMIIVAVILLIVIAYFIWSYYKKTSKPELLEDFSGEGIIEKNPHTHSNQHPNTDNNNGDGNADETTDTSTKYDFKNVSLKPFFEISVDGKPIGKIVMELFDDICPKTCMNFRYLCSNNDPNMSYRGCPFHRVIKDFMVQCGDFTNHDGTGGRSIFGPKFDDENFELEHNQKGLLSMANSGPNTNGSQFFIISNENGTPHLNGKHVVFGIVISGYDLVEYIETLETDGNDKPLKSVTISSCGLE